LSCVVVQLLHSPISELHDSPKLDATWIWHGNKYYKLSLTCMNGSHYRPHSNYLSLKNTKMAAVRNY
jgi:hypothetical protein